MNNILKLAALGGGGVALFGVAFIGFAQILGVEAHQLPIVGSRFPAPEETVENLSDEEVAVEEPTDDAASGEGLDPSLLRLGVLDSFTLRAPYTSAELKSLVDELKAKRASLTAWEGELDVREQALNARSEQLDDQETQLREMQALLLAGGVESGTVSAAATPQAQESSWKKRSSLFAEGDVDDLSKRLLTYTPDEGARILRELDTDRALELLNALPGEAEWKAYAEAYAQLPEAGTGG